MQLNGSALNAAALNSTSAVRAPVPFEGAAALAVEASAEAVRVARMSGAAAIHVGSEIQLSAQRWLRGDLVPAVHAGFDPSVYRSGAGAAVMRLGASLFYVKQIHGYGTAVLDVSARGDVGVVFIDGQAVLHPLTAEMDGLRAHCGAGDATVVVSAELAPSAIRRPTPAGALMISSMTAELDASHIDGGGVRHIGMYGDAPVAWLAEDGGMLRQSLIGSLDMSMLAGTGTLTVRRPTLAGSAEKRLTLSAEFFARRRGEGVATVTATAHLDGEIHVRGEGTANLRLIASGTGYAYRMTMAGDAPIDVRLKSDWVRKRTGGGAAVLGLIAEMGGVRRRFFSGSFAIEALNFGNAVINPYREDAVAQRFFRPAIVRDFTKAAFQREFRR